MLRYLCTCCAVAALLAVPAAAGPSDIDTLVQNAQARYAAFQKAVKDITIVQETRVVVPAKKGGAAAGSAMMRIYKKGDRFRLETDAPRPPGGGTGGTVKTVIIFDGNDTWMISPVFGRTRLPQRDPADYQIQKNWWDLVRPGAELAGSGTVNGYACYIILNPEGSNAPFSRLWVATDTLDLVQAEGRNDNGAIRMTFSDFQKLTGDYAIPFRLETYRNNEPVAVSEVRSVEFNTGLPDDLFDPGLEERKGAPGTPAQPQGK